MTMRKVLNLFGSRRRARMGRELDLEAGEAAQRLTSPAR